MSKIISFLKEHLNFKVYGVTWLAFSLFLALIPALIFMPQKYGYENGLIESIQLVVLFIIMILCLTSKVNKTFFRFCAIVLTIIIFREVNLGRTLFFHVPGTDNEFYHWREIFINFQIMRDNTTIDYCTLPAGKIVHGLYGIYIALIGLAFILKKHYITFWSMIKSSQLPAWNLIVMGLSSFCGAIAEKATNNNFIFEEGVELIFYVALLGIVYLYSRNKDFNLEVESNKQ